jgi:3-oxoacyl-[acyl-carrier protein] reductase
MEFGVSAFAMQGDVADEAQASALVTAAIERFGKLDILVCNAGITKDNLMVRMSEADFDAVLDTNLKGAFHCMKAAYRPMMKQRSGRIIALSSVVGLRGNAGQTNYAASKAGLIGMGKSLAKELAPRGVTVNMVAPGFITTDMTAVLPDAAKEALLGTIPMGKLGAPEDVANAVCFFAEDAAAYLTGQVLCVDGGMAI